MLIRRFQNPEPNFVNIPVELFICDLTDGAVILYFYLCSYPRACKSKNRVLAKRMHISEGTLKRRKHELKDKGYIA